MKNDLLKQVLQISDQLECQLAEKKWDDAIESDKKRMRLLAQLSAHAQASENAEDYQRILQELLSRTQDRQTFVEKERSRCRAEMGELGQQRKASSMYSNTAMTR